MSNEEADSWYAQGNEKAKEGENDDALIAYDKALAIDPNNFRCWNNKGIVFSRLERYEDAIYCYDKAIEIDSKYSNAWYNKANALRNFGQSLIDKANNDKPNAPKLVNRSIALFASADECYDKGDAISGKKN